MFVIEQIIGQSLCDLAVATTARLPSLSDVDG